MKSHIRRIQICVFILLHSVICQGLEGIVEKSAVLPCSSSKPSPQNVFWRDKNNKILLNINNNSEDLNVQDQLYKGRVFSFPKEYQNKNYSITLGKLKPEDAGNYECTVVFGGVGTHTKIKLEVVNSASCVSSSRIVLQMLVLSALSLIIYF